MGSVSPNVENAIAQIREAFSEVRRGTGLTLEEANLHDRCCDDSVEFEAARERAVDQHWWQVPFDDLSECGCSIVFLDEAGYLYYLPAFMTWVLTLSKQQFHSKCASAVIWSLGHVSRSGKRFTPGRFHDVMTSEQLDAVADFLHATVGEFGCEDAQAILRFWDAHDALNGPDDGLQKSR